MTLRSLGEGIKIAATKQMKLPRWIAEFLITFSMFLSADSLHQLRAAGQPIFGTIIDSFGIAAIFSALIYFTGTRSNPIR
jgi:hypothetical protein